MITKWKRVKVGDKLYSIEIQNGRFTKVEQNISGASSTEYDGGGLLYLPTLSDMHCHLDKHFIGENNWRSRHSIDTLPNQLRREKVLLNSLSQNVQERARTMLISMLSHGTTKIRTHVDIDPDIGLNNLDAILQVREEFRNLIEMEIVAFPQQGLIRSNSLSLMREAMGRGADLVGAVDPGGLDRAIEACLEQVFSLAVEFNAGVDIHLHDPGHLGLYTIEQITKLTGQTGLHNKVAVSHAWGLGHITDHELVQLGNRMNEQGVAIISSIPIDRPIPNLPLLASLGVKVMVGTDNVLDSWSPFGNGDMLKHTSRLAERFNWVEDDQLLEAFHYSTHRALEPKVGDPADFILVDKTINLEHAVASAPEREWVIVKGHPVGGKQFKKVDEYANHQIADMP